MLRPHTGACVHDRMCVVLHIIHLDGFSAKISAHRREDGAAVVAHSFGEHAAAISGHEEKVNLPGEDTCGPPLRSPFVS